jgi:hypothetical protein
VELKIVKSFLTSPMKQNFATNVIIVIIENETPWLDVTLKSLFA